MLPDGSQLKDVMIPRYDENRHLSSVLKASNMTLVSDKEIAGETVSIEFFNADNSPRGRIDMKNAVLYPEKNLVVATDAVEIKTDRMRAYGTGLHYYFDQGRGFMSGPATSIIEKPAETTMNTTTSPLRATALLGMSLLTQSLLAAPPPALTQEQLNAMHADAATKAPAAEAASAVAHSSLDTDLAAANEASAGVASLFAQANIPALPADAEPAEAKPLDPKNGPNDTIIHCTGGMYFDADAGVLVYLKDVTVKDPRYDMTGANELKVFFEKKPEESKDDAKNKTPGAGDKPTSPDESKDPEKSPDESTIASKKDPMSGDLGAKFGDVERIVATGAVRIDQKPVPGKDPIKASGAIFTYNLKTDQMILQGGYPWFTQGPTYMRAMEPNLILQLYPDTGSFRTEGNWESGGPLQQKDPKKDPNKKAPKKTN